MPGVNSPTLYSWEMEHYFYDEMETEEDFFKSSAPSENIWKKFELLPTPPMSPSRTLDGDWLLSLPAPPKVLTCDEEYEGLHKFDPLDIFGNLGSIVIKDCMWSGFSTSHRLDKVAHGERAPVMAQFQTTTSFHAALTAQKCIRAAPGTPVTGSQAAQCVNPAAVLELPVPLSKKGAAGSSGSECRSDSSDDEDKDEIDVVTVDNRPKRGRPPSRRTPVTITVSADPFGPCPKRFHVSLHRQQHNYAAPSPDTEPEDDFDEVESVRKQPCLEPSSSPLSPLSSPATSDSEDFSEQRRNFLERKRRDDLRSRFQALRQEIPGLSGSAKTSKVAILTRATDYLLQLHECQRRQAQERRKLKAKQQQLLRRISVLQNS
ncbi:protein L-Myc-1a-like [Myxocyprinus asiaticus]|uniref:protein L-Myc-1a-like n=1 Tax=Myxocyprinus asiaticus TaxID=70543 RepID=UPI002223D817|nr:protein L-Myc-1a-like [Myxocyprinus asiaticus]XP_051504552.1 protein L-Myc-1a-like [Myxocyprinus asiaticus]XP_051504553.1 protein L-Myc-1a-like [Myxocyprinus asiaticus]